MPRVPHPQQVNFIKTKHENKPILKGRNVFHTTKYLIIQSTTGLSVYQIKTTGNSLMRTITSYIQLSDENQTLTLDFSDIDPTEKIEILKNATKHLKKETRSVVFKSKFEHIGLALFEPPNIKVGIIDIIPPPAKLQDQVQKAQKQGLVRKETKFQIKTIDILKEIPSKKYPIVFPCSASTGKKFIFLDADAQKITNLNQPITIIGCPVTFETIKELNPKIPMQKIDICPTHYARKETTKNDFYIARCCRASIQGTQIYSPKTKPIIALEWEPTMENFLDAIYQGALIKNYANSPF
jgi:hypothetical protein